MDGTWRANRPVIYIYGSLLLAEEVISNIWKGWISPLRDRYIDFNLWKRKMAQTDLQGS